MARKIEDGIDSKTAKAEAMWGRLLDWKLSLWSDEQQVEEGGQPLVEIQINRDTCILEDEDEGKLWRFDKKYFFFNLLFYCCLNLLLGESKLYFFKLKISVK